VSDALDAAGPPRLAMLLIAYNQQATIGAAVEAALAQDHEPLRIVLSDDASTDGTFAAMQAAAAAYRGPHQIVLNRNPRNLGIGAHISHGVTLCGDAELVLIAAGDDISLPQRARRTAEAWLASGRRVDLIASAVEDIDAEGRVRDRITPSDLGRYKTVADWLAAPPHVIGAAQSWTRRLWDRFDPLPAGVVAEDLLMVFRAIGSGGAITLAEPLVRYRRGGISRRVRNLRAQDVIDRVLKNNRHALVEHEQLLRDAAVMQQLDVVGAAFEGKLRRERFIRDVFAASGLVAKAGITWRAAGVPASLRLRMFLYAAVPAAYAPFFWLKRTLARRDEA
jgi:glycosyltransferase involved in cell wall biosynthesis